MMQDRLQKQKSEGPQCFCPFIRDNCIGATCKFWKIGSKESDTPKLSDLKTFLEYEVADVKNKLKKMLQKQVDIQELIASNQAEAEITREKHEIFKQMKADLMLCRQEVETEIKNICQKNGKEFVSCSIEPKGASIDNAGTVMFFSIESTGECMLYEFVNKVM